MQPLSQPSDNTEDEPEFERVSWNAMLYQLRANDHQIPVLCRERMAAYFLDDFHTGLKDIKRTHDDLKSQIQDLNNALQQQETEVTKVREDKKNAVQAADKLYKKWQEVQPAVPARKRAIAMSQRNHATLRAEGMDPVVVDALDTALKMLADQVAEDEKVGADLESQKVHLEKQQEVLTKAETKYNRLNEEREELVQELAVFEER